MGDKRIWYFGLLTLSFLGLTFISGCLDAPSGDLTAAEEEVDASASESGSVATSTTTNTTNVNQIIINPAEVCTTATSEACTDDAELHKRIPYDSNAVVLARPNDLIDSLLLEKILGLSTSYADFEAQLSSIGDQFFSFINFTFADLGTVAVGLVPQGASTSDGYYFYYMFRFTSAMSDENFAALGTAFATTGTQVLSVTTDSSVLTFEIAQTEVGTDYYVVSLTETSGSGLDPQSCIIEKQIVSCTWQADMLTHLKNVKAGTETSISGTEKDDYFACNHIEGYISVPEFVAWVQSEEDPSLPAVDQLADFEGTIWVKFNSYSASYVVDATDEDDLFGYGNLQITFLNNDELQARVTAEVTESFVTNIFTAYGL